MANSRPVAIDLFCGKGGWTNALLEAGFEVYGFDIEPQPDYKGIFVQCDILTLTVGDLRRYGARFGTCSSPCEEFSVHGMKHFHPNPKYPEMGIKLFTHSRGLLEELGMPYVMENVRLAEKFIGKSVTHCGPFYLWGNAVPAIMPRESYKVTKGMDIGSGSKMRNMTRTEIREYRSQHTWHATGSKSKQRCAQTAEAAMIPPLIARAIAQVALHYVEVERAI